MVSTLIGAVVLLMILVLVTYFPSFVKAVFVIAILLIVSYALGDIARVLLGINR